VPDQLAGAANNYERGEGEIVLKAEIRRAAIVMMALAAVGCGSGNAPENTHQNARCAGSASVDVLQAEGLPTTAEMVRWIEELTAFGFRRTGTEPGRAAAAWVKCQFEALGLQDVAYERSISWDWHAESWSLQVAGDEFDAFPSAHSFVTAHQPSEFSTGPDGLSAEVVDVRRGGALNLALNDIEGKIVIFDLRFLLPNAGLLAAAEFVWDPRLTIASPLDTLLAANPYITNFTSVLEPLIEAGAVGFIGVLADYFDSNQYYNEFYRSLEVTIPGMWVTEKEGARMRRAIAAADGTPTATLHMEGYRREAEGLTVVGFLPGKSQETILVQSHHDSVWQGAVQDGSGVSAVLALARYFATQPPESRERTLMFSTFDTHFSGYQAHQDFVRKYVTENETPYELVAAVGLEHIARQAVNRDGVLTLTGEVEPRGIMENLSLPLKGDIISAVIRNNLERTVVMSAETVGLIDNGGLPTDLSFLFAAGVPVVSLIAGPLYLYDAADTLEMVAVEELRPTAKAFAEIIEAIDATPSNRIGGLLR
jgi:hypothetical protein